MHPQKILTTVANTIGESTEQVVDQHPEALINITGAGLGVALTIAGNHVVCGLAGLNPNAIEDLSGAIVGGVLGTHVIGEIADEIPDEVHWASDANKQVAGISVAIASFLHPDILSINGNQLSTGDMPLTIGALSILATELFEHFRQQSPIIRNLIEPAVEGMILGKMMQIPLNDLATSQTLVPLGAVSSVGLDVLCRKNGWDKAWIFGNILLPFINGYVITNALEQNIPALKGISPFGGLIGMASHFVTDMIAQPMYKKHIQQEIETQDDISVKIQLIKERNTYLVNTEEKDDAVLKVGLKYLDNMHNYWIEKAKNERYCREHGRSDEELEDANEAEFDNIFDDFSKIVMWRNKGQTAEARIQAKADLHKKRYAEMRKQIVGLGKLACANQITLDDLSRFDEDDENVISAKELLRKEMQNYASWDNLEVLYYENSEEEAE